MRNTPSSRSIGRRATVFPIVAVLLLSIFVGCEREKTAGPEDLLRDIPPELARHLIESDDSTLARYGRTVGFVVLSDASEKLGSQARDLYARGRDDEASRLNAYHKRIARVLASEYDYKLYLDQLLLVEELPRDARRALLKEESDFYAFRADLRRSSDERVERYTRFLETFQRYHDVLYVALTEYELSYALKTVGEESQHVRFLRAACSHFAECGLHEMTSPALGELGDYYQQIGEIDSMVFFYEESRRIADKSRLPWETASVDGRYARYYARQGRLSLAHDLLARAIDVCREYKGEYSELGHIVDATAFEARLGCWGVVDRMLARARVLQTRFGDDPAEYSELFSLQLDVVEGRSRMAKGEAEAAEALFRRAEKALRGLHMPYTREPENARLYAFWSAGLLENGRPDDALKTARRGVETSREADLPELAAQCSLLMAKAALQVNDLRLCRRALDQFDLFSAAAEGFLDRERVQKYALLGTLEMRTGDRRAAEGALEQGLRTLRELAARSDASVQSYLSIGECDELRQLMHAMTSHDPTLGYGAELLWQDYYRLPGSGGRRDHTADSGIEHSIERADGFAGAEDGVTLADIEARARMLTARISELGAIHGLYAIHGERILRWTASSGAVRCDTIVASTEEVGARFREVWEAASYEGPDSVPRPALTENLRTLGRLLLPPELVRGAVSFGDGPFFVTADGFLSLVPFEAFDAGTNGEYSPLLLHHDVAYLRCANDDRGPIESGPGVIVVNPFPSDELRSRYFLHGELKEALREGEAIARLEPGSRLLTGASAKKSNLTSLWQDAPFLYFATHTVRDPEVPYLMLIPLAAPDETSSPDAAYLDFTDIREADFRRCGVVVLSGCSSGAPYVDLRNFAPSLGDAFLDAGAGSVIQTFWDVRDEDAAELMTRFIPAWNRSIPSSIHALNEARRTAYRASGGIRNLSAWASFYIETSRP